jgi:hypothetical protein
MSALLTPKQVFCGVIEECPALALFPFSVDLAMVLAAKQILRNPGKCSRDVADTLSSPRGRLGIAVLAWAIVGL